MVNRSILAGSCRITSRTGVHRGHEHEAARQRDLAGAAGNGDMAVLQRLAQDLEGGALELGQFVEEEHAMVGEGDFAGSGDGAAAEQADVGDGVVRGAARPGEEGQGAFERLPGGRVDAQHVEELVERRLRHDAGDALGDHGLSRAGRSDHDEVVRAGHGDLGGPAHRLLALDFREVGLRLGRRPGAILHGRLDRGEVLLALEEALRLIEGFHLVDGDAFDQCGLAGGDRREQDGTLAEGPGQQADGQPAPDRTGGAGEAELAGDQVVVEPFAMQLVGGGENAEGDGEVVKGALLAQAAGREIDGGAGAGALEAGVAQGGGDAVGGLLDGGVGQADEDPARIAGLAVVDLDLHGQRVDARDGGGTDDGEHRRERDNPGQDGNAAMRRRTSSMFASMALT